MANVRGVHEIGGKQRSLDLSYDEFVPSFAWTEDPNAHYLLVDLPDFKKEEVKLQVDNNGHITISGQRKVKLNKYSYFEQTLEVPENSDIQNITGQFDGEILYVTVPKKPIQHKEQHENEHEDNSGIEEEYVDENVDDDDDEAKLNDDDSNIEKKEMMKRNGILGLIREWEKENNMVKIAIKKLVDNKGIVMIVVVAFSLGVLITRKSSESS